MQTASICSLQLPLPPFSGNSLRQKPSSSQRRRASMTVFASKKDAYGYGRDHNGRIVDENMIVLRKRIHEAKMAETRDYYESSTPPRDCGYWMEWEKKYAETRYDSDICEAMAVLQTLLMETRPSLVVGMVALVGFTVPASMAVAVFHLVEMVKAMLG
ncbi:uncharacterized protein LOC114309800 [Camellia sinensis]|uniref:Uncharacterized protein n=1 Tax=Camellia sinensis var. sinensis TaxID=542762 RepID=A0A4S4DI36_CAMSN|nr:uncharacterized protein LOC114309800 [Camellia sinensis]THG02445.1 hypothetical protein TEA_022415 [Camellia sinensis var. sinensis]